MPWQITQILAGAVRDLRSIREHKGDRETTAVSETETSAGMPNKFSTEKKSSSGFTFITFKNGMKWWDSRLSLQHTVSLESHYFMPFLSKMPVIVKSFSPHL